ARLLAAAGQAGPVPDHLHRDVPDLVAGLADQARGLPEQPGAGGALPLGAADAEVRAEVADPGGGEQGVAGGVAGDVGVGVPLQRPLALPAQARDPQVARGVLGGGGVHVHADADPGCCGRHRVPSGSMRSSRRSMSSKVTFGFVPSRRGIPETRGMPRASGRSTVETTRSAWKSEESRSITVAWTTVTRRPRAAMCSRTCSATSAEVAIPAPHTMAMVSIRTPGAGEVERASRARRRRRRSASGSILSRPARPDHAAVPRGTAGAAPPSTMPA